MKKTAENNPQFERTFADLANAYLRDKAPKLIDFMLGFQILDKNEDETRAAGVFGFKVGNQMLYAPVFFLNGELKGHELLYIKEQDTFVPMQENWVNYLINRKPVQLGHNAGTTNRRELGIMEPNLAQYANSPISFGKQSNAFLVSSVRFGQDFDLGPFLAATQVEVDSDSQYCKTAAAADITAVYRALGVNAAEVIARSMQKSSAFSAAMLQFYDMDTLLPEAPVEKQAAATLDDSDKPLKDSDTLGFKKVQIISGADQSGGLFGLTEDERTRMQRDGIVIRDHRKDTSQVYRLDLAVSMQNPSESGVYDILVRPNTFEKMLVIAGPKTIGKGHANCLTVVRLDGKRWCNAKASAIWSARRLDNEWKTLWDDAQDVDSLKPGDTAVFIGEKGEGSLPFTVVTREVVDGVTRYMVSAQVSVEYLYRDSFSNPTSLNCGACCSGPSDCGITHDYPSTRLDNSSPGVADSYFGDTRTAEERLLSRYGYNVRPITINPQISRLVSAGNMLMVPKSFKALKLKDDDYNTQGLGVEPGSFADVYPALIKAGALRELTVWSNNGASYQYRVGDDLPSDRLSKAAALRLFVGDDGLAMHADDALAVLDEAALTGKVERLFKAASGPYLDEGPGAPSMALLDNQAMGQSDTWGAPTDQTVRARIPVDGMQTSPRRTRSITLDDAAISQALAAGRSGQKEVFDVSVLSGLVKAMNSDDVVDRYLGDLITGLDRVGRILFMFYWHNDRFVDRYGQEEMQELEDALRNTFKGMGDLVLFLKKKTIEPDMAMQGADVDLGEIGG